MNLRSLTITVLALAVLAGGLTGCSSLKRLTGRQTQTVAKTPAATYQTPQYAPSTPTYSQPQMPSMPPPVVTRMPAPAPLSAPNTLGGFSDVQPTQIDPQVQQVASAIAEGREAQMRVDQQILALEERLRQAEMNAAPAAPPAPFAPAPGGTDQATRFADSIRGRTSGEVVVVGNRVTIRLADAFQPGSEKLRTSANLTSTLLATAQELSQHPGARIEVVGHSDGTPLKVTKRKWRDNVHLSRERAQTVASTLSKHGVSAGRMAVDGRGSVEPLVFPEKTAKDRARNRRVEVVVHF